MIFWCYPDPIQLSSLESVPLLLCLVSLGRRGARWLALQHSGLIFSFADTTLLPTKSKYAFATFLGRDSDGGNNTDYNSDNYYVGVRILAYQLLHDPETRSNIPLIVLVTQNVENVKRQQLQRDGAIIWEVAPIDPGLLRTEEKHWQDTLAKLRLWQLTQFERIAFLDADTVLFQSIADIFNDPAVAIQETDILEEISAVPKEYAFAGNKETEWSHRWPPTEEHVDFPNINYFNAGFIILRPDTELFKYYISLTKVSDLFDAHFMEQSLLNYAHRRDGNMPWQQVDIKWAVHFPTVQDIKGGVRFVHEKWWDPFYKDVGPYLLAWKSKMEEYFDSSQGNITTPGSTEDR
ncbi:glycosyltransferase family 8 protein [Acidomyces richmondensis BFW]|nr:MAG: glycosyltransferase family 8 protein [Acidomyces sp. 'richmondensis']KYG41265.1 glycosyltransferase family 8 protein [Acidomyces richmondensis BFW]